jgi:hypothetical protein
MLARHLLRSAIALSFATFGCVAEAPIDADEISAEEGTDLEPQGARTARDCDALLKRTNDLAAAGKQACLYGGMAAAAQSAAGGIAATIVAVGGKVPPPLALAIAATSTTCYGLLPAIQAGVDAVRSSCRAQAAYDHFVSISADACTRMNDVPRERRRSALPEWCPERKTGLYYCGARAGLSQDVPCISFEGDAKRTIGTLRQFTATVPVAMTFRGMTSVYRRTSYAGRRCFVPADAVTCSR